MKYFINGRPASREKWQKIAGFITGLESWRLHEGRAIYRGKHKLHYTFGR